MLYTITWNWANATIESESIDLHGTFQEMLDVATAIAKSRYIRSVTIVSGNHVLAEISVPIYSYLVPVYKQDK